MRTVRRVSATSGKRGGKGFLLWGAFVMFGALFFQNPAHRPAITGQEGVSTKALGVVGGLMCFGVCVLWYRISQTHDKRGLLPRLVGGMFFVLGSFMPYFALSQVASTQVMRPESPAIVVTGGLLLSAVLLGGAYFLQFRRKCANEGPSGSSGTQGMRQMT